MKIISTASVSAMTMALASAFSPSRPRAHYRYTRAATVLGASTQKMPLLADESVMAPKAHGTSDKPVMKDLRWNCDFDTADRICNFNRHYAEFAGVRVFLNVR